jgi:hypothetical protein
VRDACVNDALQRVKKTTEVIEKIATKIENRWKEINNKSYAQVIAGRAAGALAGDTRRGPKHGLNRRKEDYSVSFGYRNGREGKKAVKREDRREDKGKRRRYICESPDRRGKKAKKRRFSGLRRQFGSEEENRIYYKVGE